MTDEDEAAALYRIMRWQELVVLRHAFTLDRREAVADVNNPRRAEKLAFCDGRIRLIDAELGRPLRGTGQELQSRCEPND